MNNTKVDTLVNWLIVVSSVVFILILALSAVFDPSIRVLHVFQAFVYVAVIILAERRSAWGYGAGCLIAAFWNFVNLFHTTFIANGVREFSRLVRTGELRNPDQLIAVFAATAHFVLIVTCLIAFFRMKRKTSWDALKFLAGGLLAIGYFVVIIILFGRQYVPLLKRVFHV